MNTPFETPIALIVFNRPELTSELINVLRKIKPRRLFVIADGPRVDNPVDIKKCQLVQEALLQIDWECDLRVNRSDVNLGCRDRPITGISWVFDQVEEAIILEDDCIPDLSFFRYCEELLERYKNVETVGLISGTRPIEQLTTNPESYMFSKYPLIWGWATWKRTWDLYDGNLETWKSQNGAQVLKDLLLPTKVRRHWKFHFDLVSKSNFDAWDYQLAYLMLAQKKFAVIPNQNLISNKGFGKEATHTFSDSSMSNLKTVPLSIPLFHPQNVKVNEILDSQLEDLIFQMSVLKLISLKAIYALGAEKKIRHFIKIIRGMSYFKNRRWG